MRRPIDWTDAACNDPAVDPEWFFPPRGTNSQGKARKVCKHCPIKDECLAYALDNNITHGMWGGESERSRRRIRAGQGALAPEVEAVEHRPNVRGAKPKPHDVTGDHECRTCLTVKDASEFAFRKQANRLAYDCRLCEAETRHQRYLQKKSAPEPGTVYDGADETSTP